jgi:UDP-glucose 4-epimerase
VFGTDYPTADGSGVRDYVHVLDLAQAHLAVLDRLEAGHLARDVFNVGTGHGASVLEVLALLGQVSGLDTRPEVTPRRAGDPASVVAAVDRLRDDVGWQARHGLPELVSSAWAAWRAAHP